MDSESTKLTAAKIFAGISETLESLEKEQRFMVVRWLTEQYGRPRTEGITDSVRATIREINGTFTSVMLAAKLGFHLTRVSATLGHLEKQGEIECVDRKGRMKIYKRITD